MEGLRMVLQKHVEGLLKGVTEHGLRRVLQKTWKVFGWYYKTHGGSSKCVANTWRVFRGCYRTQGGSSEGNIKHIA
jgi:hypothetical protein